MCKILIMAGLDPSNEDLNWEFIQSMGGVMSKSNTDGLGYTAVDEQGNMFGERWHNNYDAFDYRPNESKTITSKYKDVLKFTSSTKANSYSKFGKLGSKITAITLHTRFATSGKEFANIHPFVDLKLDTALIHNGVIRNVTKEDNIRSTCDSERILNKYLEHKVMKKPSRIQDVVDQLTGYYACGVVTKDSTNKRVIDLFKCNVANLHGAFVKELGCMVFSTSLDDIKSICKEMGLTILESGEVESNKLVRLDAKTGEILTIESFKDTFNYSSTPSYESYWNRNTKGTSTSTRRTVPHELVSETQWQNESDNVTKLINKYAMNAEEAAKSGFKYDKTYNMWVKNAKA